MYVILLPKIQCFQQAQGKIFKAGFCKVYFSLLCGNKLFLLLRNMDMLLLQVTKVSFPTPVLFPLSFFIFFSLPLPRLTVTAE